MLTKYSADINFKQCNYISERYNLDCQRSHIQRVLLSNSPYMTYHVYCVTKFIGFHLSEVIVCIIQIETARFLNGGFGAKQDVSIFFHSEKLPRVLFMKCE